MCVPAFFVRIGEPMRKIFTTIMLAAVTLAAHAQKTLYIPDEWKVQRTDTLLYKESDPDNQYTWSKTRSKESDNFIVYWDKYYGSTAPNQLASSNFYYVDIDDLLEKAEWFYQLNVETLGFANSATSKVNKYKSMILLNHSTEWMAYGGGYDFNCPALWVNPATCKPVGHTIAHEIGHSFQYICYSDLGGGTGFHNPQGQGSGWWEQTAQWQAAQAYPTEKWGQSWTNYGVPHFPRMANYAMTHEWMRYQSYWWHYFLVEKYNDREIIGKIWRHDAGTPGGGQGYDANEVLMSLKGLSVKELYQLYFEYAMKMATVDIDVDGCREEGLTMVDAYPYDFHYTALSSTKYQVAYRSCPQATGFNVIPLNVPTAGTVVSTDFTSLKSLTKLAEDDPKLYQVEADQTKSVTSNYYNCMSNSNYGKHRGFRLGYVALLNDGSRVYLYEDSLYCAENNRNDDRTVTVSATVPENTKNLWLVVSPAPRSYYRHLWDENITNDDQWPYTVEFTNTNISGAPIIDENLPTTDATITYDIELPYNSSSYYSTNATINGMAASALGTAFQMKVEEVASHMVAWSSSSAANGKMKFYALNPTTDKIVNAGSTANGYGHWFTAAGVRTDYNSGYLYSEFNPDALTFTIGQYPGRLTVGQTYTIGQALQYKRTGDKIATVRFHFNVKCVSASSTPSCRISNVEQSETINEVLTDIGAPEIAQTDDTTAPVQFFTLSGTPVATPTQGFYLRKRGNHVEKIYVK